VRDRGSQTMQNSTFLNLFAILWHLMEWFISLLFAKWCCQTQAYIIDIARTFLIHSNAPLKFLEMQFLWPGILLIKCPLLLLVTKVLTLFYFLMSLCFIFFLMFLALLVLCMISIQVLISWKLVLLSAFFLVIHALRKVIHVTLLPTTICTCLLMSPSSKIHHYLSTSPSPLSLSLRYCLFPLSFLTRQFLLFRCPCSQPVEEPLIEENSASSPAPIIHPVAVDFDLPIAIGICTTRNPHSIHNFLS